MRLEDVAHALWAGRLAVAVSAAVIGDATRQFLATALFRGPRRACRPWPRAVAAFGSSAESRAVARDAALAVAAALGDGPDVAPRAVRVALAAACADGARAALAAPARDGSAADLLAALGDGFRAAAAGLPVAGAAHLCLEARRARLAALPAEGSPWARACIAAEVAALACVAEAARAPPYAWGLEMAGPGAWHARRGLEACFAGPRGFAGGGAGFDAAAKRHQAEDAPQEDAWDALLAIAGAAGVAEHTLCARSLALRAAAKASSFEAKVLQTALADLARRALGDGRLPPGNARSCALDCAAHAGDGALAVAALDEAGDEDFLPIVSVRLQGAALADGATPERLAAALASVEDDPDAAEALSASGGLDGLPLATAAPLLEAAATPAQRRVALRAVGACADAGLEKALKRLAAKPFVLDVDDADVARASLEALAALSARARRLALDARAYPLGARLDAPRAVVVLLADAAEAGGGGLAATMRLVCGGDGVLARGGFGGDAGAKTFLGDELKGAFDRSYRGARCWENDGDAVATAGFPALARALAEVASVGARGAQRDLRDWASSELLRLWARNGAGSGVAFGELRRSDALSRLSELAFADLDRFAAEDHTFVTFCVSLVCARQAGARGLLEQLAQMLAAEARRRGRDCTPRDSLQRLGPSLFVTMHRHALDCVLRYLGGKFDKVFWVSCLSETTLQICAAGDDERRRRVTFVEGVLGEPFAAIVSKTAQSLVERFASELAGPRSDEARLGLQMVAFHVYAREAEDRPKKKGTPSRGAREKEEALRSLVGEHFLRLMAEIIQVNWKHASSAEKARRVRVVKGLVEHLSASDAAKYAHKVLGVLSAALDEGSGELSAVSVTALSCYARLLPEESLRRHLAVVVTALVPCLQEVGDGAATLKRAMAKRASELLHWLLVERRAVLGPAFASVPRLPDVPGNAVVDACRAALVDERAKTANLDAFLGRSQHEPADADADGGDAAAGPASLRSELQRLAPLLEADAPGVRAAAATALSETLTARHDDFAALVFSGDVGQARTPEVDDVASALLRGAARGARDRRFRLAVATALGDLGALDPALVRVSLHARSDPTDADAAARRESSTRAARAGTPNPATSGKKKRRENEADELREPANGGVHLQPPPWAEARDVLGARVVARYLVSTLRAATSTGVQDRSAFAIQELLKLMDPDADDAPAPKGPPPSGDDRAAKRRRGTPVADGSKRKRRGAEGVPDWARKIFAAGDCYETVLTYAATTYAIALPPRERKARQEFVASSGHDARLWVKSWARHLAVFARSRTHAPVFVACHALMRDDDRLCAALLPYLVADALCCGEDADALDVARELTKALEVAADPVVLNLVFSLHATIERWHDAARALEREDAARARSRGAVPATSDRFACFVDEDGGAPRKPVSELLAVALEALPPAKLADAAASIGADARSVLYRERALRAAHLGMRQLAGRGAQWHDGADGYVPVLGQADIEQLEVVACRLDDDADYLGGLSACRRRAQMPGTLRQRVREMEQEAQWQQALDGYEHVLRAAEGAARADAARGLLRCLLELGHCESALLHADGLAARGDAAVAAAVRPFAAEAAMKLGRWDRLERDARGDGGGDARVALATCVAALQTRAATGDAAPFRGAVDAAKLAAMERLSASTESYGRAYPYVAQLHAIREVEHAAELLDDPDARESVLRRWDDRLLAGAKTSAAGWLAVRRVCLEVAGLPEDAGTCAMRSAKVARRAGRLTVAFGDVRDACRLGVEASALALAEAKLARCAASGGGDTEAQAALRAYAMLEPVEADLKAIAMKFGVSGWSADDLSGLALFKGHERHRGALVASQSKLSAADRAERADVAKRLVLATDCLVDARLRHGVFAVVKRYELAVALRPDWARAYVSCGRYFDVLLASRRQQTSGDDDDGAGDDGGDVLAHEYAKAAMTWYARGLEQGAKEAPSALPRLVTLWFEFGSVSVEKQAPQKPGARPSAKTERAKALERLKQEIYDVVRRASLSIPAAVWYTVTPQLVSRAAHPNPSLMRGVSELLAIILHAHPDEAVWAVTGLTQSLNPDRKKVGSELFSLAVKRLQKSDADARDAAKTQKMLTGAKQLFADLIAVAKHVPPDSAATVDMRRVGKQVKAARGLLVPTRAALTAAIAPRGKGGLDWPKFPDDSPRIDKFQDNIIVMKSKAKPKKLTLEASNGRVVRVLCKREKDGDLRKDARVNDFNDVVNRLLDADDEARRRKLHLRTFAVVILDEECGLMEWVNRTHGLRFVMEAAYGLHPDGARRMPGCFDDRIRGPFEANQRTYAHDGVAMAREYRKIVLGQYEPCFSRWFAHRFGDEPAAWLGARATFARSSAIWSAVGHVLGLGDRHGENIMVDIDRGEQVHVDFDCIFDKGTRLKTPEIVPFRLTPHMVEAFGVTGVEGCFRRSLEVGLHTLRHHRETLLNVLEPFIRDPTVGWSRTGKAQRDGGPDEPPDRGLGDRNGAKATSKKRAPPPPPKAHDDPKNVLRVVAQRLDGIYNVPVPPPPGSAREREDRALARARGVKKPDELPLSVPGQVERLIKEATADTNLCRMYIGWTPFL